MLDKCRACLSTDGLFSWNVAVGNKMTYADLFFQVTKTKRTEKKKKDKDEESDFELEFSFICEECGSLLRETFHFIERAKIAAKVLKKEYEDSWRKFEEELSVEIVPITEAEVCGEKNYENENTVDATEFPDETQEDDECQKARRDEETELNFERIDFCEKEIASEELITEFKEDEEWDQIGSNIPDPGVSVKTEQKASKSDPAPAKISPPDHRKIIPQKKDPTRNRTVKCEECEKVFRFPSVLKVHMRSHNNQSQNGSKPPFDCAKCGRKFPSSRALKYHMKTPCDEKQLCDICHRYFNNILALKKHKVTHEKNRSRNHICSICDMRFLTSSALKGHVEVHDAKREKRHKCDQCEKAFFQRGALTVHRRLHTGELITCGVCGKRYPRKVDLEIHMRSHTGATPFECSTCGGAFKYASTLYTHMRREHYGYNYSCNICSMLFPDKESMVEHKSVHKNSVYKCVLCDKGMSKKFHIKRHIRTIHNIKPEDAEEMIASCKAEKNPRRMRNFCDFKYKHRSEELTSQRRKEVLKREDEGGTNGEESEGLPHAVKKSESGR